METCEITSQLTWMTQECQGEGGAEAVRSQVLTAQAQEISDSENKTKKMGASDNRQCQPLQIRDHSQFYLLTKSVVY